MSSNYDSTEQIVANGATSVDIGVNTGTWGRQTEFYMDHTKRQIVTNVVIREASYHKAHTFDGKH